MKHLPAVVAMSLTALLACDDSKTASDKPTTWTPAEASSPMQALAPAGQPAASGVRGRIVETMNSGGYTYVQVDTGANGKVWAAGPTTPVKVGDTIGFGGGMVMKGFQSKTLNRTFDTIYFVGAFDRGGASAAPASMPADKQAAPAAVIDVGKIEKAQGGLTVAEIFAQSATLAGKEVRLRGKVVKYNSGIMGKNWLHVQDGSGAAGSNDLTVTTNATAEVGDVLVVKGIVATNKDFGAGYQYALLIEDATLTK